MKNAWWTTTAIVGILIMLVLFMFSITGTFESEAHKQKDAELLAKATEITEETSIYDIVNISYNNNHVERSTEIERVDVPETTEEPTTVSIEELAEIVLNYGINGDERKAYLGNRYAEVQNWLDANYEPPTRAYVYEDIAEDYYYPSGDGVLTPDSGINYYYGVLETYYNLDMSWNVDVMRGMGFDAENYPYWVRGDGVKMLGDYVMCAADFDYEPRGTITDTSLGMAIVVDTGAGGWAWHDICVTW